MRTYQKVLQLLRESLPRRRASEPVFKVFPAYVQRLRDAGVERVLEIGSRDVTGHPLRASFAGIACEYVGLDILPGEGVDVVGDAHKLSQLFPAGHFDAIHTTAVFEHLAFPWKVALEMNRVLKPGGICYVQTHPNWPAHQLPWDFYRFQANGFHALFNQHTGFRVLEVCEGVPCKGIPLLMSREYAPVAAFNMNLSVAMMAVKVGEHAPGLSWDIDAESTLQTMYPAPD